MATRDRDLKPTIPGLAAAAIWLLLAAAGALLLFTSLTGGDAVSWGGLAGAALLGLLLLVALNGFLVVQPNQAKVAVFLGRYLGTVRRSGFHWVNPLTSRRNLSLRIRNLDTDVLKVNDANGNPIEISAVITWQVSDAARPPSTSRTTRGSSTSRRRRPCATWPASSPTTATRRARSRCGGPPTG